MTERIFAADVKCSSSTKVGRKLPTRASQRVCYHGDLVLACSVQKTAPRVRQPADQNMLSATFGSCHLMNSWSPIEPCAARQEVRVWVEKRLCRPVLCRNSDSAYVHLLLKVSLCRSREENNFRKPFWRKRYWSSSSSQEVRRSGQVGLAFTR